uniref:BZIP transcription factor 3 n=1 Tax=Chlorella sp. HS2 TaxID=2675547 RepID=A0A8E4MMF9_9CHLO|nr:bZIP transcription factor 3 [Chlorella sp. HS2]
MAQGSDADGGVELELELAGLPAREREAALKRFKNREAARRSRERKAERISGLQGEVDRLRANNFVLLKCVEEVAHKALAARGEQRRLRDKLAKLVEQPPAAARPGARRRPSPPGVAAGEACTPPAATRAAALERQLLEMEAGPASPTQLLLPRWPQQASVAAAAPASVPLQARPTSAELRRELRRAVAGEQAGSASGSDTAAGRDATAAVAAAATQVVASIGPSTGAPAGASAWHSSAANLHHLLQPSPVAASRSRRSQPQQLASAPLQGPTPPGAAAAAWPSARAASRALVLADGPGLLRTCSDPGDLAAAFSALPAGPQAGSVEPQPAWFLPSLVA